jgi:hypothetical protein
MPGLFFTGEKVPQAMKEDDFIALVRRRTASLITEDELRLFVNGIPGAEDIVYLRDGALARVADHLWRALHKVACAAHDIALVTECDLGQDLTPGLSDWITQMPQLRELVWMRRDQLLLEMIRLAKRH